ncbi:MAG: hypothetical protein V3U39_12335 [Acidimicrobiia bacterium]
MLPQIRRYILVNNSGSLLSFDANGRINIKETAYRFNTAGEMEYVPLPDDDLGFIAAGTVAHGAEVVGDNEIDNRQTRYVGSQLQIEITHDEGAAADGTFTLYMAQGMAQGELEEDASGYNTAEANKLEPIGSLTWESNGGDDEVMRSPIFEIGG